MVEVHGGVSLLNCNISLAWVLGLRAIEVSMIFVNF